jgi:hypothetical protein
MKRRDLIAGLAFAASAAEGQQPGVETLYIPKAHLVEDRTLLHDFMENYAFVDLVTATPSLRITHIPTLLDLTPDRLEPSTATSRAVTRRARRLTAAIRRLSYFTARTPTSLPPGTRRLKPSLPGILLSCTPVES